MYSPIKYFYSICTIYICCKVSNCKFEMYLFLTLDMNLLQYHKKFISIYIYKHKYMHNVYAYICTIYTYMYKYTYAYNHTCSLIHILVSLCHFRMEISLVGLLTTRRVIPNVYFIDTEVFVVVIVNFFLRIYRNK